MRFKDIISVIMVILLLAFLVLLNYLSAPQPELDNDDLIVINPVGQSNQVDLQITKDDINVSDSVFLLDNISVRIRVWNMGGIQADQVIVNLSLERNGNITEIDQKNITNLGPGNFSYIQFWWIVPADTEPGEYLLTVNSKAEPEGTETTLNNNEAFIKFTIKSMLEIETKKPYRYPGKKSKISITMKNFEAQDLNLTLNLNYYKESENKSLSKNIAIINLEVEANKTNSTLITWEIPDNIELGGYIIWVNVSGSLDPKYIDTSAFISFQIIKKPDTETVPVYTQTWFIIGLISLIIFFLTIILSLIGVIPQDRLPIQPALVVMALVIMVIALVGNYLDPEVHMIGAQDIAGMIIIHPITALTAGFLVAGGLEAAGAFAAAADALARIEKLKFKGKTIFGFVGTVVILTNIPTLIAMPCGRILGAALMPAALFFGYRIAKAMGDARMVGVVVFPFIVNAAASCGPSPLGGIGTIGEGLSKMPIGSFTTAQSTGIMICTGVCALFMRYITFMRPADLSDEDIKHEKEAEAAKLMAGEGRDDGLKTAPPAAPVALEAKMAGAKIAPTAKPAAPVAKKVDDSD